MKSLESIKDMIFDNLQARAIIMCDKYCKYGEQYKKDQEKYDNENPTYNKYCVKCPMCEFFTR